MKQGHNPLQDVITAVPQPPAPLPSSSHAADILPPGRTRSSPTKTPKDTIPCIDPGTGELLGYAPAMTPAVVHAAVSRARVAAAEWRHSSFAQRRRLLAILLKYTVEHQESICRVSAKDSGKPMVDAAFGELIVTCEKMHWLMAEGEHWLRPESRSPGRMMFYKKARVEYHPLGVVGAIVPFNYPFHNIFNPLTAAVFAGNAIVIKVSEHGSWSALHYKKAIQAALAAAGAPADLVQIVTGYGDAGHALVTSGVNKLIFVGSTQVGRKVMAAAADSLTPVVLELGGKDAFIVCDDADLATAVPTAMRGAFQACGQNCTGAERFVLHEKIADKFVAMCAEAAGKMRQGPASGDALVDFGSLCLPGLADKVQALIDDALAKGGKVVIGGVKPPAGTTQGQFYPPTILTGVTPQMRVWREEVFGPVMACTTFATDDQAVAIANDCAFGLGSSVFSRSTRRARGIASRLEAGMSSINDFAATYMAQSLPFGGVKESGFDRFAGVEGLRGMCLPKAVAEDRWPFSTAIPPVLQYPVKPRAFDFVTSLVWMFYAPSLMGNAKGLLGLIGCFLPGGGPKTKAGKEA